MSVKPGIRLGERYQLLAPIATGGMGQVWRAEDTTLHRVVAAKILRSEFTGDETFLERFRAEARNTASLSHPNIASVYDYGEQVHDTERLCYLVMELVEGKPLVDILTREHRLTPDRTLDYLEQTAMGLAAAHRENIVHRDIKPGNLIIRPDGVLKITDFGIARAANSVALTERGTVVGTAQYLAPEQAEGKPAQPASDIYALGVVGYECLAGSRPFDGDNSVAIALAQIRENPRPLPADVPPHVRTLIEVLMRKDPNARYVDGTTVIPVIRAVQAGNMPPPPVIRAPRPNAPARTQLPGTPLRPPAQSGPPQHGTATAVPTPETPNPAGSATQGPGATRGGTRPPGAGAPNPARPVTPRGPGAGGPGAGAPPGGAQPPRAPRPSGQPAPMPPAQSGGKPPAGGPPASAPAPGVPAGLNASASSPSNASSARQPGHPPAARQQTPQTGTGMFPPVVRQPPPAIATGNQRRALAWYWIALGVLLVAAVIAITLVLVTDDSGEPQGSAHLTITHTELKESLR
ncbi:protein kinase domain-containing protein [Cumulibacter soli]|uniref:protein kinase domain-containing protein n=1 Tax=Cumulibacter soli TaxID=2546344 RepID=UPI0010683BB9|nr:protein kinase [Cumulibacter soli]